MGIIDSELSLNANVAAYHWDRDKTKKENYNEVNPGIGITAKDGDLRYMVGQYKNSLRGNSNYGLMGYTPLNKETSAGKFSGGVVGGAVTGYPNMPVAPVLGLMGAYEVDGVGVTLIAVPTAEIKGKTADGFLGLQMNYKIK